MRIKKEINSSAFGRFVSMICFVTVFSQLPVFVESGITNRLSIPAWVLLFVVTVIRCGGKINITELRRPLSIVLILAAFYGVCVTVNSAHVRSSLPYVIGISTFLLLTGHMAGKFLNRADLELVSCSYVLASFILSVVVYLKYFTSGLSSSPIYLYEEKNSTAQILMTAVILIMTLHLNRPKPKGQLIYIGVLLVFAALLFLMRSRATLIFIPILCYLVLVSKSISGRLKWLTLLALFVATVVLILDEEMRNSLLYDVMYAGRDESDLNSLSSGRWAEWQSFFTDLGDGWLFGHGRMKRESLILVAILEFGVIFGSIILVLAAYPIFFGISGLAPDNPFRVCLISMAICYFTNGIFEQLAPFGPGVKCFFLWFLLGIVSGRKWKNTTEPL